MIKGKDKEVGRSRSLKFNMTLTVLILQWLCILNTIIKEAIC